MEQHRIALYTLDLHQALYGRRAIYSVPFAFCQGNDSVQFSSVAQLCLTLCNPMNCSTPGLPVLHYLPDSVIHMSLLKLRPSEVMMPSNHPIPCCPLLLMPSIFPSIRIFSNELALHISGQSIGASASILPVNI